MKVKKIKELDYSYGDEQSLIQVLYKSKEPLLIKIKNFPDRFNLDYFIERFNQKITYSIFENDIYVGNKESDLYTVLLAIKDNNPYRVFGVVLPRKDSALIEYHIPLWQKIPLRPRFFKKDFKVGYYFGGKGAHTEMHYDREHCCNLHVCLSGKKEVLLFTQDQSDNIYKLPFISDSWIDFGYPLDLVSKDFKKLEQAEGYQVLMEKGDMLFLPRNCWHYTTYHEASSAATYVFYPHKFFHFYGYFTGHFFLGYKVNSEISEWPWFKSFNKHYVFASGIKKYYLKAVEKIILAILFFPISIRNIISNKTNPDKSEKTN
ncbi:cupin-like domain-containing protein [Legionella cincinnatiensis]|uniref:Eukaryotic small stress protein n=1 Tax=Legionella cincinnatiensis TaxID=28085 RepID=A0A378IF13_9GAMM|nr:cupin-like domain-containing protein [Legionella cincinnatiensis]KTC92120.1 eukaryotic small stress protein PASS1 [Legionella cincinnatiensis]STX33576.1 eukaryotic small stress protein [Legionella cincinnatiensis]